MLPFVLMFACALHYQASAQSRSGAPSAARRSRNLQVKALPNGIQISAGRIILQITALRDDVLRVRAGDNGQLPEDACWAVLPYARSYAGGQRYAATWTGDNSSTWNHLRMTVPQLINLGLSGFAISGADVGGFAGSPSPDLPTRWLQLAAFQPIDRDHAAKGTRDHEPWVDGPEHEAIRRHFIEERYRLMPYLYTTAEETSRTGLPIMRSALP